jgi:hypothetical protein
LIVEASLVTGVAVAIAAFLTKWPIRLALTAAFGSFAMLVLWRGLANALHLNADFAPGISVGDNGCLVFGAATPLVIGVSRRSGRLSVAPAVTGALVGFVVNVVIL